MWENKAFLSQWEALVGGLEEGSASVPSHLRLCELVWTALGQAGSTLCRFPWDGGLSIGGCRSHWLLLYRR